MVIGAGAAAAGWADAATRMSGSVATGASRIAIILRGDRIRSSPMRRNTDSSSRPSPMTFRADEDTTSIFPPYGLDRSASQSDPFASGSQQEMHPTAVGSD